MHHILEATCSGRDFVIGRKREATDSDSSLPSLQVYNEAKYERVELPNHNPRWRARFKLDLTELELDGGWGKNGREDIRRARADHPPRLQHVELGRQETERERENGVGTEERHYY